MWTGWVPQKMYGVILYVLFPLERKLALVERATTIRMSSQYLPHRNMGWNILIKD